MSARSTRSTAKAAGENQQPTTKAALSGKSKHATSKHVDTKKVTGIKAGKKAKAAALGNSTNYDINALLAAVVRMQEQMQEKLSVVDDDDSDNNSSRDAEEQDAETADMDIDEVPVDTDEVDTGMVDVDKNQSTESADELEKLRAALRDMEAANDSLRQQLEATSHGTDTHAMASIPRPSGVAGKDFSIQVAMNLAGSSSKDQKYKALQRRVKDLVGHARIPYEVPWKDVPAKTKSTLFEAVRQDQPFLARYKNDWATEELAKQYLKNKRKNAYKNGWLIVSDKYSHLKANAAKRSVSGSRRSKAKAVREDREAQKAARQAKKYTARAQQGNAKAVDKDNQSVDDSNMVVDEQETA
ncbi:hypothetical protein VKT23_012289 [Stygiomarasmius scandens]|uniref:Uncharacterized protein n=1 Tax=Marasmiellus scandens TaxID=2682957 RepID=A0ABR1J6K1_9AGAR